MKANAIKMDYPTSKKLDELSKMIDNIENKDEKTYLLSSPEQKKELEKKGVLKKLKNIIQKQIDKYIEVRKKRIKQDPLNENLEFLQIKFNKKRMNKILKYYENVTQNYHKKIDKLKNKQNKKLDKLILKALKKYSPKNNDEKTILFTPVLEQDIYDEYDILILIKNSVFNKKEQKEYASLMFDYNYKISKLYLELAKYYNDNSEIEEYQDLINVKKELKKGDLFFTDKHTRALKAGKYIIEKDDAFETYDEEIILAQLSEDKLKKARKKFIKTFFDIDEYNKDYFNFKWVVIEEIYKEYKKEDHEYIPKKILSQFIKNKDTEIIVDSDSIYMRNENRKNIEFIKKGLLDYMKLLKFDNLKNNAYISHFLYPKNNKNKILKVHEYIKLTK